MGDPTYRGSPCLYHDHSQTRHTRCWRDSRSHACLQCLEAIEQHRFGLRLDRFPPEVRRNALKFWSHVDITDFDDCWQWTKPPNKNQLYFFWKRPELRNRYQWHPIAVSVWLTWGDTGRLGTESICGNRRCVNPLHNLPKGLLPSVRPEDYDDQWLRAELHSLKSDVADYLKSQTGVQGKPPHRLYSPSCFNTDTPNESDEDSRDSYLLALASMSQQVLSNLHPMQRE